MRQKFLYPTKRSLRSSKCYVKFLIFVMGETILKMIFLKSVSAPKKLSSFIKKNANKKAMISAAKT